MAQLTGNATWQQDTCRMIQRRAASQGRDIRQRFLA